MPALVKPQLYSSATSGRNIGPSGRIWPNGEFGLCYCEDPGVEEIFAERWEDSKEARALDLSKLVNSHRASRGTSGLTGYGGKMVRNSAFLLEEKYKGRLSFLTLTLPGVDQESLKGYARDWSRIVKVFFQKLSRVLEAEGLPTEYVAVTEVQGSRLKDRGEFALHLHCVFVGRKPGRHWALTPGQIRWMWASVLGGTMCQICDHISECYCGALENLQPVRKSASGYLGKYITKGRQDVAMYCNSVPEECIPSSWYSIKSSLKRKVKRRTSSNPKIMKILDSVIRTGSEAPFAFIRPIELKDEKGHVTIIGWYGKLSAGFHAEIEQMRQCILQYGEDIRLQ